MRMPGRPGGSSSTSKTWRPSDAPMLPSRRWWRNYSPSGSAGIAILWRSAPRSWPIRPTFPARPGWRSGSRATVSRGAPSGSSPIAASRFPTIRLLQGALGVRRAPTAARTRSRFPAIWCSAPASCRPSPSSSRSSSTTAVRWRIRSRTTSRSIWRPPTTTSPTARSSRSRRRGCAGGVVVERFERQVRPDRPISPAATRVHGYTDQDLLDKPSFEQVWPEFRALVGQRPAGGAQRPALRRAGASKARRGAGGCG